MSQCPYKRGGACIVMMQCSFSVIWPLVAQPLPAGPSDNPIAFLFYLQKTLRMLILPKEETEAANRGRATVWEENAKSSSPTALFCRTLHCLPFAAVANLLILFYL
ncbi:hypothetical protein E2320_021876 [Naja naja]|nr:hypothetical protein E2320_021876 [Naja naja]